MIPGSWFDANFLKSQVYINTGSVANSGVEVIAIISDGNRKNRASQNGEHQRYRASFSNSHKVMKNYLYITKRFGRTSGEPIHSVISDKNDPRLDFLINSRTKRRASRVIVYGKFVSTLA